MLPFHPMCCSLRASSCLFWGKAGKLMKQVLQVRLACAATLSDYSKLQLKVRGCRFSLLLDDPQQCGVV
jgi:hypothetical protein